MFTDDTQDAIKEWTAGEPPGMSGRLTTMPPAPRLAGGWRWFEALAAWVGGT
ncbi:MAG: hypothetical protein ACRDSL_12420 [Pseudonocardiaceae bacterium]